MSRYDAITALNLHFSQLERALNSLYLLLEKLPLLTAQVFVLPEIIKGTEHDVITQIAVTPKSGEEARYLGIQHFQRLFIYHNRHNISSKASVRLPGVLCFGVDDKKYRESYELIAQINQLKSKIEQIVTIESGLKKEQRFEFVHEQLHGLITLNTYRALTVLINPSSVRFGWANKQMIKHISREEILVKLNNSLSCGRAVSPFSREQWMARITQEIQDVKQLAEKAILKIKRPVKVQPVARVWYRHQQKQVQHPCPMPLIALCQEKEPVPVTGALTDYDVTRIRHKYKPDAKPLRLLIPRLHLYVEQ